MPSPRCSSIMIEGIPEETVREGMVRERSFLEELKEHVSEHFGNELADSRRTLRELRDRADECEATVKDFVHSTVEKKAEN